MKPKVKFEVASIKHIIPPINDFLNLHKRWDWSRHILDKYPVLDKKLKNVKKKSERNKITHDFFEDFILRNKDLLEKKAEKFQKEWNKINNEYMVTLSEVLEIDWPEEDKQIRAFISPNPICPRYIKQRIFDVYHLSSLEWMKAVAMHEILHFLYFEKWKEFSPKTNEKHFNAPHLVWKLSEIVPKAILSDERVQEIFKHNPTVYDKYYELKINGKPLLDYLDEFYFKRKNFKDFLKKSWEFVNKHKSALK